MAIRRLNDGRWAVYYRRNGKLTWEYFGRGDAAEAAARARHQELGIKTPAPSRHAGPLFEELARAYFSAHQFATPAARDTHVRRMAGNVLPFFGHRPAARISDQDIEAYIKRRLAARSRRRKTNVTLSTVRRELVDVKAIFAFAARRRPALIPFNPIRDYRLPRERAAVVLPPTAAELARLLAAAPEHVRRILRLNYFLGCRPGPVETYSLRYEHVNWDTGEILITSAKKGGPVARLVPIHLDLLAELKDWHAVDKERLIPWIVHFNGKKVSTIHSAWKRTLAKAGIDRPLRPYSLRHLFITEALARGADTKTVSEIVGSSPQTIMATYQHVARRQHRTTIAAIPSMPTIPVEYSQ